MITLPDAEDLVERVQQGLDAVAAQNLVAHIPFRNWFPSIASEVAVRLNPFGLKCHAKGIPLHCSENEFSTILQRSSMMKIFLRMTDSYRKSLLQERLNGGLVELPLSGIFTSCFSAMRYFAL